MKRVSRKNQKSLTPFIREQLSDPKMAAEFLIASVEEGLDLKVALREVVKALGASRYAKMAKELQRPNILRAVRDGANPRIETVTKLLAPLGLRLGVIRGKPVLT